MRIRDIYRDISDNAHIRWFLDPVLIFLGGFGVVILLLALAITLGGCETSYSDNGYGGGYGYQAQWRRVDGAPVGRGFNHAVAECRHYARGEHNATGAMHGCMRVHNYVWE